MYAVVRQNTYNRASLDKHGGAFEHFDRLHVEHPGFLGHLAIEVVDGSTIVVNVWESDSYAQAGLHALGPDVERLVAPGVANAGPGE